MTPGGFRDPKPQSLYRRWLPAGFLTSHSRVHGAHPLSRGTTEKFTNCSPLRKLKYKLMPYVYAQSGAQERLAVNTRPTAGYPAGRVRQLVRTVHVRPTSRGTHHRREHSGRMSTSGRQKWIDYQTGKVYARDGTISSGTHCPSIHSRKRTVRPSHHPRGAMHRPDEMDKIAWKKYLADEKLKDCSACRRADSYNGYQSHNRYIKHIKP